MSVGSSKRIVLGDWGNYGWVLNINDQDFELEEILYFLVIGLTTKPIINKNSPSIILGSPK